MAISYNDFFSKLNPLIAGILRSPVHFMLSPGLMLLTVTGRKSGRCYTIPVGYQRNGDDVTVLVSQARTKQWWRNYREPGEVEMLIRGRKLRGSALVTQPGSEEFRVRSARTLKRMPWLGSQFGIEYDKKAGLDEEQHATLAREIAVVRLEIEGPA